MERIKINPEDFPRKQGESWWVVHPNLSFCEFKVPVGGYTYCTESFLTFKMGTLYHIVSDDSHSGWITLMTKEALIEMPYYVFARYFDAEAFVKRTDVESMLENRQSTVTEFKG